MKHTKKSLEILQKVSEKIQDQTFHHHYYVLLDLVKSFHYTKTVNYLEIGAYAGGSACLVAQRPKTNIISVDLGKPIDSEVAINNVNSLKAKDVTYNYIKGNSQSGDVFTEVYDNMPHIDVLFIDGDHSGAGMTNDFNLYKDLVVNGGYIVFDDYNDAEYSPEVKAAVDNIVSGLDSKKFEIIGTIPNEYGARPDWLKEGNCFIIKKK